MRRSFGVRTGNVVVGPQDVLPRTWCFLPTLFLFLSVTTGFTEKGPTTE
jgi:hypothetical protein